MKYIICQQILWFLVFVLLIILRCFLYLLWSVLGVTCLFFTVGGLMTLANKNNIVIAPAMILVAIILFIIVTLAPVLPQCNNGVYKLTESYKKLLDEVKNNLCRRTKMKCKPRTNKYFMVRGKNCGKNSPKNFQMTRNIWNERKINDNKKGGINSRLSFFIQSSLSGYNNFEICSLNIGKSSVAVFHKISSSTPKYS